MGSGREARRAGTPARRNGDDAVSLEDEVRWTQLSEAKRLKSLEEENRQLKRLVADQALNLQVVKDLLGKKW